MAKIKGLFEILSEALDMDAAYEGVKRLGLKADNTAADRAKALGFDDKTYYHGTNDDIEAFSPEKTAMGNIWFAENPKFTDGYTSNTSLGAGNVIPLKVKQGKIAGWDEYDQLGLGELEARGYDSAWLPSKNGESTGFVLDPHRLRSKFARFNPKYAGVGAGSILSADLMANEQNQPTSLLDYNQAQELPEQSHINMANLKRLGSNAYGVGKDIAQDPSLLGEVISGGLLKAMNVASPFIKGAGIGGVLIPSDINASEKYTEEEMMKMLQRKRTK